MAVSVVFLLGAGFSAPYGIPTMRPFLHSFRRMAQSKYPDLHDTLEQHFARLGDDSDIEELLSGLGKAERLSDAMPGGTIDSAELRVWQEQSRYLKSHLISYIIEQCERYDEESVKAVLSPSLRMLTDLAEIETVHIFTTNYDRIVEVACEEADIEYADGFGETGNELVAPWTRTFDKKVCIYKLHGSVSYYVDQARRDTSKFLRLDRGYPLPGPDFRLSREGNELEPLMVLPTLEKDALGEPYSHLNHLFTEVMSETVLVVAVGISLRDNHIVGAINFNADTIIVLLVDVDPTIPGHQIADIQNVKLRADAKSFFEGSVFRLANVLVECVGTGRTADLLGFLEEFSNEEARELAKKKTLTDAQQKALERLVVSVRSDELLEAIRTLRGLNEDGIIQTIGEASNEKYPSDVRKAVAGCLGHSGTRAAIGWLGRIAKEDVSSDVRLEAYLALSAIGSDMATEALDEARGRWPSDSFFST